MVGAVADEEPESGGIVVIPTTDSSGSIANHC
jgi:hypothetical protein